MRLFSFGLMLLLFSGGAVQSASAKGRRARFSGKISKSMNGLKWGMSRKQLQAHLADGARAKFKEEMDSARGAIEKDRVRVRVQNAIRNINDSYVEFSGTQTGWDASFLRDEYAHNNGESMFMVRDKNSQNFYFLKDGKLWKWYKAFNSEVFPHKDFGKFAKAIEGRFGKGTRYKTKNHHGDVINSIGWQDKSSVLRALDQTQFYGFYCLVFENKSLSKKLRKLHAQRATKADKKNSLVDKVTGSKGGGESRGANVVDSITGKNRGN